MEGFEEKVIYKEEKDEKRTKSRTKRADLPPLDEKQRQQVKQAVQKTVEFEGKAAIDGEETLQHKIRCCLYPNSVSPDEDISAQASQSHLANSLSFHPSARWCLAMLPIQSAILRQF